MVSYLKWTLIAVVIAVIGVVGAAGKFKIDKTSAWMILVFGGMGLHLVVWCLTALREGNGVSTRNH